MSVTLVSDVELLSKFIVKIVFLESHAFNVAVAGSKVVVIDFTE